MSTETVANSNEVLRCLQQGALCRTTARWVEICMNIDKKTDIHTDRHTDIQTHRHTHTQTDRPAYIQTDAQKDRQIYRHSKRHTNIDKQYYRQLYCIYCAST